MCEQAPVLYGGSAEAVSGRLRGMTGSLRLSALLLLLLGRWASADLEKGEDEFVRSWVIIEEQLVPPSRDELLAGGGVGVGGGSGGGAGAGGGRRITPKSVFVAPSFNKCSDGYRPDNMGRCVKVVKLNQAAQWDFLLKQLSSMYGPGGGGGGSFGGANGFPMPAASAYQPTMMTTTTTSEPSQQKTDSPGPFQVNIPLVGMTIDSNNNQTAAVVESSSSDESPEFTTTTTVAAATTTTVGSTTVTATVPDDLTTTTVGVTTAATAIDTTTRDNDDEGLTTTTVTAETSAPVMRQRFKHRYQTTLKQVAEDATEPTTVVPFDDPTTTEDVPKNK